MAREDNLIPFTSEQNREEAKKNGRKGGIASGEARRLKKTMRQMLKECLEMEDDEGHSYQELATVGLLKGAMVGNASNYRTIVEVLGELIDNNTETPSININIIDNSNLEKVMYQDEE